MKRTFPVVLTLLALFVVNAWNSNQAAPQPAKLKAAKKAKDQKVLRHVVMFKFKEDATDEQIKAVEQAFAKLPEQIDTIKDFEWGTNNSPEGLDKGFTHCFFVTFADEDGRAEYLPHPKHKAFVSVLKPILDDVFVVDYWAKKSAD